MLSSFHHMTTKRLIKIMTFSFMLANMSTTQKTDDTNVAKNGEKSESLYMAVS